MFRPDITSFSSHSATPDLDYLTWDTAETITIGARDIIAVEQMPSGDRFPASSGPVSRLYLRSGATILVRESRANVLADIAALAALFTGYVLIEDQRAQNTHGGTHTAGSWQTRVLNTIVSDVDSLVLSLASNQVELSPGDWVIAVSAPCNSIGRAQIRLQDLTAGAPGTQLKAGSSEATAGAGLDTTRSILRHRMSFSSAVKFEVQMQGAATVATFGFGSAANFTGEVYTIFEAWKLGEAA